MEGTNSLPQELWDHILSFLTTRHDVAVAALVCRDFHSIVRANAQLSEVLQLPIFEEVEGSEVLIDQLDRRARFPGSYADYPSLDSKVYACVRANPNATTAVVHFRIDCDPSEYFCLAVTTQSDYAAFNKTQEGGGRVKKKSKKWYSFLGSRKKEEKPERPEHGLSVLFPVVSWLSHAEQSVRFMASYYHDGDIHAHGNHAPYNAKDTETAQFKKGDIISVQVGLRDLKTATSSAPGWAEVITVTETHSNRRNHHDVHPYVIFYKNFNMVYQPLVFPQVAGASAWPLRICPFFTAKDESVQIIAPPPEKLPFRPLLPTAGRLSPAS